MLAGPLRFFPGQKFPLLPTFGFPSFPSAMWAHAQDSGVTGGSWGQDPRVFPCTPGAYCFLSSGAGEVIITSGTFLRSPEVWTPLFLQFSVFWGGGRGVPCLGAYSAKALPTLRSGEVQGWSPDGPGGPGATPGARC